MLTFPNLSKTMWLVLHLISTCAWKLISLIWYAWIILNSIKLVPSGNLPSTGAQKALSLPLFFCTLTTAIFSCLTILSIYQTNYKIMLLALSWEFSKLIFLFILLLSIFCPLIHENSTNSLLCAATNSAQSLLASWPNSLRFANKHTSCTLLPILPLFVFPLCACTYLVRALLCVCVCVCCNINLELLP